MRRAIVIITVLLLASCASDGAYTAHQLDQVTGVTITYSLTPMAFYRDESGKAAYARSFIDMAPLEVNRMGDFRYFLWLGIWNTLREPSPGDPRDGFESIVIFADGEPLSLEVSGWSQAAIGASQPVYLKSVSSAADAYYEITIDHLRVIAAAKDLRIMTTGTRPYSFELWDEQRAARASLDEFLDKSVY